MVPLFPTGVNNGKLNGQTNKYHIYTQTQINTRLAIYKINAGKY